MSEVFKAVVGGTGAEVKTKMWLSKRPPVHADEILEDLVSVALIAEENHNHSKGDWSVSFEVRADGDDCWETDIVEIKVGTR